MLETVVIHHVSTEGGAGVGPRAEYSISPDALDTYLRSREDWTPVSVADGLEGVQDDRKYLVTFDDGYRNNLTEALPVLEWHDVPCLFFLTTGFINGSVYPYELELAAAVEKMDPLSIPGRSEKIPSQTLSDRRLYRELRRPLKPKQHDAREAFMDQLADRNDYDRAEVQKEPVLNWDEVRELSDHPLVTIGVHTHSHVVLAHQPWRVAY